MSKFSRRDFMKAGAAVGATSFAAGFSPFAIGGAHKGKKVTETITATLSGDKMELVTVKARPDGRQFGRARFKGQRTPPLPPLVSNRPSMVAVPSTCARMEPPEPPPPGVGTLNRFSVDGSPLRLTPSIT